MINKIKNFNFIKWKLVNVNKKDLKKNNRMKVTQKR